MRIGREVARVAHAIERGARDGQGNARGDALDFGDYERDVETDRLDPRLTRAEALCNCAMGLAGGIGGSTGPDFRNTSSKASSSSRRKPSSESRATRFWYLAATAEASRLPTLAEVANENILKRARRFPERVPGSAGVSDEHQDGNGCRPRA